MVVAPSTSIILGSAAVLLSTTRPRHLREDARTLLLRVRAGRGRVGDGSATHRVPTTSRSMSRSTKGLLLPGSLFSIPPRVELNHLITGLRERDQGLLRVDVDGAAVRDDGLFVKRDEILMSGGSERLIHALMMQERLRVLRWGVNTARWF